MAKYGIPQEGEAPQGFKNKGQAVLACSFINRWPQGRSERKIPSVLSGEGEQQLWLKSCPEASLLSLLPKKKYLISK